MRTHILKKYKLLICCIALCVTITLFWIVYGPYGASKYGLINTEIESVTSEIETLTKQNKALNEEIIKLKGDRQYLEDVARKDYGLLKKNEMVFEFKKK